MDSEINVLAKISCIPHTHSTLAGRFIRTENKTPAAETSLRRKNSKLRSDILSDTKNIHDTGERMLPTEQGEISMVFSRHQFTYNYIKQYTENKSVLDIGCGTGYGSKIIAEKSGEVLGIDLSGEAIKYCRDKYKGSNLTYLQADALTFVPNKKFDIVIAFQVIEHIKDLAGFINKLRSIVKQGGKIIISTPNIPPQQKDRNLNEYHVNEMTYNEFKKVLEQLFDKVVIMGVAFSTDNILRKIISSLPFYSYVGKRIKRNSKIKKIASNAMDMTKFKIIDQDISKKAADLLALCDN